MNTVNYPQFNYTARSKFSFILCTLYFYALTIPLLPLCSSKTSSSMSLYRCVVVAGTASQSETELEAKLANQSQSVAVVSLCPIVQPNAPAVPPLPLSPLLTLCLSTNRAMMKAMYKVFDLYSVFVITCSSFCSSFSFFFFFLLCAARRLWNAFMPIQCILLVAACPLSAPIIIIIGIVRSVPIRSVRFGSVSRCLLLCVRATNVCLRKPFLAF